MAKKRKSTTANAAASVAVGSQDNGVTVDSAKSEVETTVSEWSTEHTLVGYKFRTILPFWLLPSSARDMDSTCYAVIIAHRPEDKGERQPELFRVMYAVQKECSCGKGNKSNNLGLDFPDGPLRANTCINCNARTGNHLVYFNAEVTRNEIPNNSKVRRATMVNTDTISEPMAKRKRYFDAVSQTTVDHYNKLIMPHLGEVLMGTMQELEWEHLCKNDNLNDYKGVLCDQLLQRIRDGIELCRLANDKENVITYKVPGSRVMVVLKKIFLSEESTFNLSATYALLDALSSIDKYLLCEVLIEMVKEGSANCDRVFDTVIEMTNKSRFRSLIVSRKLSNTACSSFWELHCPPIPPPTEAEVNQDAQLALMLEKEEENEDDDAVIKRSVRASSRSKSSAVYYGAYNTNLSNKEATEVVYRLISQSSELVSIEMIQSLLLNGDIPSEVDVRKIRSILGSLLCGNRIQRIWCTLPSLPVALTGTSKLISYLNELRKIEHLLRVIVIGILQKKCGEQGLSESMDSDAGLDQEKFDENDENLSWTDKHPFVGSKIHRGNFDYDVVSYTPSIPLTEDDESAYLTSNTIIKGKPVSRRGRLKCVQSQNTIYLTEPQVFAAMEAYRVYNGLIPVDDYVELKSNAAELVNRVGYKVVLSKDAFDDELEAEGYTCTIAGIGGEPGRILLLFHSDSPKPEQLNIDMDCVWGTLLDRSSKIMLDGMPSELYVFWHGVSQSADEAMEVLNSVKFHQKAAPFLEPVDPVSMNLPDYFKVVKTPMDLSMIEKKLASGRYFHGFSNEIDVMKLRRDFDLIWNNAMAYNIDGSWIYNYAMTMKKFTNRKIDNAFKKNRSDTYSSSIYYEPDYSDDEFESRTKRSRSSEPQQSLITPASAIEKAVKLSSIEENLPLQTTVSLFTLPENWLVKKRKELVRPSSATFMSARLSRRAASQQQQKMSDSPLSSVTYYTSTETACDRAEIEVVRVKEHESYAIEYQNTLKASNESGALSSAERLYSSTSFPPYLGRVAHGKWEIQSSYIGPAMRWIIRGLINSKHLIETEEVSINSPGSGAVILANVYWKSAPPFDILDDGRKVVPKRKSKEDEALEKQKEKEAQELSEYEKMRAERVARNQERLKMLGLG